MVKQKINYAVVYGEKPPLTYYQRRKATEPERIRAALREVGQRLANAPDRRPVVARARARLPKPICEGKRGAARALPANGVMSTMSAILLGMKPGVWYTARDIAKLAPWIPNVGWVRQATAQLLKNGALEAKRAPRVSEAIPKRRYRYSLTKTGLARRERDREIVAERIKALGEARALDMLYAGKVRAWLSD